jgi:ABC-type amino acid transport system permease subunit
MAAGWNWSRVASIIAGVLSSLALGSVAIAEVWASAGFVLPYPQEVSGTIDAVIKVISAVLAAFTVTKVAADRRDDNQEAEA